MTKALAWLLSLFCDWQVRLLVDMEEHSRRRTTRDKSAAPRRNFTHFVDDDGTLHEFDRTRF